MRWRLMRVYGLLLAVSLILIACDQPSLVERIKADGVLLVATRNSPTTYYMGASGPQGPEHDLVKLFADELNVEVEFVFFNSFDEILPAVRRGQVHMAAAGLSVTQERRRNTSFSRPYQLVRQQVVYRRGSKRPAAIADISDGRLYVLAGTSHEERLENLKRHGYPDLTWQSVQELETEDLMAMVDEGEIDFTIVDSNDLALNRRFFAHIGYGFEVGEQDQLAWAFAPGPDQSLKRAADHFLNRVEQDGRLTEILAHYYEGRERLGFVDMREFWEHVDTRLPPLEAYFLAASEQTGFDWRLLAAIGYQESHWNPKAVSPTGVRGVMMLTQAAAKDLGIKNRRDPKQSIIGGARYLRLLEERIPDRIAEPDRLLLAMAGYNVGFGHLEDARVLTERQGGNPDSWADVRERLPLLARKKYYKKLRHGYARGWEPVNYVDNIQRFYELLVWHSQLNERKKQDNGLGRRGDTMNYWASSSVSIER